MKAESITFVIGGENNFTTPLYPLQVHDVFENTMDTRSALIIMCELIQNEKGEVVPRQKLYGIELAQLIRKNGFKGPIVFTSFLTRKQVFANKLERAIINTVGHSFIQLPCRPQDWINEIEKIRHQLWRTKNSSENGILSDLELYDIQNNYCRKAGLAQYELHALHGVAARNFIESEPIKKHLRDTLKRIFELFGQSYTASITEFDELFPNLSNSNKGDAIRFIENKCGSLVERFSPTEVSERVLKPKNRWSLLFLDDEIGAEGEFVSKLQDRGVDVHCARTVVEARVILEADTRDANQIVLVVSDYRLDYILEGIRLQQPVQGYRFLKELSQEKSYIKLAALSSLPRRFLIESFKHYGVRVDVFSKKDYMESRETLDLLCDELILIGDDNFEAITRLPRISSEGWELYEPYYQHHRNSVNYLRNESYISMRAKAYCDEVKNNRFLFELKGYTVLLEGKTKDPSNPKAFQEFIDKMICRRVVIWYSQFAKTESPEEIYPILKGVGRTGNETKNTITNQINTNLALRLSDFPWNMTIEEKYWLMYDMGMSDIEEIELAEQEILNKAQPKIIEWSANRPEYANLLIGNPPNTFSRIKSHLNRIAITIHEQRKELNTFQLLVTGLKSDIDHLQPIIGKRSRSVQYLYQFLQHLANRNRRIDRIPVEKELDSLELQEIKSKVLAQLRRKIPQDPESQQTLESIAYLFFYELRENKKSYQSISAYVDALLKQYKEEQYLDPNIQSLAEWSNF